MTVPRSCLLLLVAAAVLAAPAEAQPLNSGLGPYYDGVGHLLLAPQDLLPLVGIALFAGLGGPPVTQDVLMSLPIAWLIGGVVGLGVPGEVVMPLVGTLSILVAGGLVAADPALPRPVVAAFAATIGLIHGFSNGTSMSAAGLGFLGLLGTLSAAFVAVAFVAAFAISMRHEWHRTAVRVAGSWIAASGLLMLGWTLRDYLHLPGGPT